MKKLDLIFVLALVLAFVYSCQKMEQKSNQESEDLSLKTELTDPTSSLVLHVIIDSSSYSAIINNQTLGPIATLWRKNSNCTKLGICKWLPKNPPAPTVLIGRDDITIPILYNSNNHAFEPIILEFTSSPSFLSIDDIKFYIDEDFDIEVMPEMNIPYDRIRIEQGVINYNSSLGTYGGYSLNIVGVE